MLAVLLGLYTLGAVANQIIFQLNRRRGLKFPLSGAMFGFCMARIGTCVLRLAWTTHPYNIRLAIAAMIFTNIGGLVLYVVVLLLALRVFRALHPVPGWNKHLKKALAASYIVLTAVILGLVGFTIASLYSLDPRIQSVAFWYSRGANLYILLFNVLSLALFLAALLLPRAPESDDFGAGTMKSKLIILGIAVFFSTFIAGFRTGTVWAAPRPASDPAWYDSKAAFYVVIFSFELIIVYTFLIGRFDTRFWVPNGSTKPRDFHRLSLCDEAHESLEEGSSLDSLPSTIQSWPTNK